MDVVLEICTNFGGELADASSRFKELFALLETFLANGSKLWGCDIHSIRTSRVFPILEGGRDARTKPTVVLRPLNTGGWYIPDRTDLESAFHGKVNLLNLTPSFVKSLGRVLAALDCAELRLSVAVEQREEPRGVQIRDDRRAQDLKERLRYLAA